jgi:RNA polymerase sigma factor (sigma-70 family)
MVEPGDGEVYAKYAHELIRFSTALAGPSDAADVLATAMVSAMSSARWAEIDNKRAYLYRAVVNAAHDRRRSTQRRLNRELRAAGVEAVESVYTDRDVIRALRLLTVRQRAAIYLTYWSDLTAVDISPVLGVSPRTVERELTIARRRLGVLLS